MSKIDLKKQLKHLYRPSGKEVHTVDVPPFQYCMIDGLGDPNTSREYQQAIEALFGLSYTLTFMVKKGDAGIDYGVMPLEGLWWVDDMTRFSVENKSEWQWTAMIMQPRWVTAELFDEGCEALRKKKDPPALVKVRLERLCEGGAA